MKRALFGAAAAVLCLSSLAGVPLAQIGSPEVFAEERAMVAPTSPILGPDGRLYVVSSLTDEVWRFDAASGAFVDVFASVGDPAHSLWDIAFGPDGHLYGVSTLGDAVLRFHGRSGAPLGVFATGPELVSPVSLHFGPDGNLYVASYRISSDNPVLRYDGATGAFIDGFVPGHLLEEIHALEFGPGGDLYVGAGTFSEGSYDVLRFDGTTGAPLGSFLSGWKPLEGSDLAFGPDGRLWVTDQVAREVVRYDGATGAFVDVAIDVPELRWPSGLCFDGAGHVLVSDRRFDHVVRCDVATGAFLGVLAEHPGLRSPADLAFGPGGHLLVGSENVGILRFHGRSGAFLDEAVDHDERELYFALDPMGVVHVTSPDEPSLWRYDGRTGEEIGKKISAKWLVGARHIRLGPDGYLYVALTLGHVVRFEPAWSTTPGIEYFVSSSEASGAHDLAFGPNGDLYVSTDTRVVRFDGTTGAYLGVAAEGPELLLSSSPRAEGWTSPRPSPSAPTGSSTSPAGGRTR
jgi:outer membrane protein assembly factor BamB